MKKVHFIAIGGSAMHNLAIALHKKGFKVSGSDDEIFEPSAGRLANYGLLPEKQGWFPEKITSELEAIILGMHAIYDNPELVRARELGITIYSYPEYLYEQTKDKTRVVIGGSHGKTTITSMVMHVLKQQNIAFDFMVGAQLEGFDTMVNLSHESKIAVFEGDEYLASTLDPRPKFHLYKPHIALLSGVAWDHINVFPTFEMYVEQFSIFADSIVPGGSLIYYEGDAHLRKIGQNLQNARAIPYDTHPFMIKNQKSFLKHGHYEIPLEIFGEHNMQNLNGARLVCNELEISDQDFYKAISTFKGAAKRLQLLASTSTTNIFLDFAHSPSKLEATVKAVKQQFPGRKLIACMELHTFSSLNENFLEQYNGTMNQADEAIVYFNPATVEHKRLKMITKEQVHQTFAHPNCMLFTDPALLQAKLRSLKLENTTLLFMSSGNFSGINFKEFSKELIVNNQ